MVTPSGMSATSPRLGRKYEEEGANKLGSLALIVDTF